MSIVDDPSRPSTLTSPDPAAPDRRAARPPRPGRGLFRAFWRWHFYAAVVVVPVLFVLATTGLVYLFRFQIEPLVHGDLLRVEHAPGGITQPYETQLAEVTKSLPGATVVSVTEPGSPDDSTRISVETAEGENRDVFVDPYAVRVLGSLDPDTTVSGLAVRLHADLMAGRLGDVVMELGACWAIVMALTGYYLYARGLRARRRQRAAGAPGSRLRASHARFGAGVGVGLLLLVVSGLPWTGVWGEQVQRLATTGGTSLWAEDPGALSDPTTALDESLPHSHHTVPWAQEKSPVPSSAPTADGSTADVDTAVEVADRAGLTHPFTVTLPADENGVYSVIGYAFDDPGRERTVHVDRFGGRVVSTYGYEQYPTLAKVVAQGIALHEGRRFGTVSFWATAAFCAAVIASCVTGPLLWWRRRPRGSGALGAPRGRLPLRSSPVLAAGVALLAVALPVFGVSLVVVLLVDHLVVRRSRRLAGLAGTVDEGRHVRDGVATTGEVRVSGPRRPR